MKGKSQLDEVIERSKSYLATLRCEFFDETHLKVIQMLLMEECFRNVTAEMTKSFTALQAPFQPGFAEVVKSLEKVCVQVGNIESKFTSLQQTLENIQPQIVVQAGTLPSGGAEIVVPGVTENTHADVEGEESVDQLRELYGMSEEFQEAVKIESDPVDREQEARTAALLAELEADFGPDKAKAS